jgi:hypothetical protein
MKSSVITALSVSTTLVAGSNIYGGKTYRNPIQKRGDYGSIPPDDNTDVNSICGHDPTSWDDRQSASDDWWSTGAGYWLDSHIKLQYLEVGKNPDNWLAKLNQRTFQATGTLYLYRVLKTFPEYNTDETDNTIWDCATIGGQCQVSASCSTLTTIVSPLSQRH